jgi:hypothetical protein
MTLFNMVPDLMDWSLWMNRGEGGCKHWHSGNDGRFSRCGKRSGLEAEPRIGMHEDLGRVIGGLEP